MLISTGWRIRGAYPTFDLKNYWSDYQKNRQGVRDPYFIDKYCNFKSIEAFLCNGSKTNFRLRTRPGLAASKMRNFGQVWTQQMNQSFRFFLLKMFIFEV